MSMHPQPVVPGSAIGIIPNPMSGRDIRRLIAQASVFPNTEKASMVLRIIRAAGALGVERVLMSTDKFGIAAGVLREMERLKNAARTQHVRWPEVEFLTLEHATETASDTTRYTERIATECAAAVVLLGGDGTMRAAAPALGDTPMLALSTGTNNAFPIMIEATVGGMAAGLVATGRAPAPACRSKLLHVAVTRTDGTTIRELALVDVCVNSLSDIGARALWKPDTLRELYCTFAEPHAIGLSSIAGQVLPTSRTAPDGVGVTLDPDGVRVLAPIAPGLLEPVGVGRVYPLLPNVPNIVATQTKSLRGTIALDGEREVEFGPNDHVTVTLTHDGPYVIDVPATLAHPSQPHVASQEMATAGRS
ncbi:ATP-NAD/AcoX kinase [Hoyosella subflava DQS3-9A1]|uniref:ATP-NAD/AcoX kinase n=1 Tax=Hoyosella subflava (strain DSM 45089 / JCM 17490 / NBRC 109087 / DQS3-9A1) TaxID=443218 RepID=F6EKZ7_HOYSD|nr:ATP-NAD/AcoX kinase [Hoyosella subflava DQS3-9A1]